MENLILFKILQHLNSKVAPTNCNRYRWLLSLSKSNTGFTLIEVLIATLIFGILAAIATPSWFSFITQQRLNKANDAILSALQEAQRQAKLTKHIYNVSFIPDTTNTGKVPLVSIYPDPAYPVIPTAPTGTPLGGSVSSQLGQITLYTNIGTSTITQPSSQQTISFDSTGALLAPTVPVKIAVAAYQPGIPISSNVKRQCVIVQTLIGGMQTAQDSGCIN